MFKYIYIERTVTQPGTTVGTTPKTVTGPIPQGCTNHLPGLNGNGPHHHQLQPPGTRHPWQPKKKGLGDPSHNLQTSLWPCPQPADLTDVELLTKVYNRFWGVSPSPQRTPQGRDKSRVPPQVFGGIPCHDKAAHFTGPICHTAGQVGKIMRQKIGRGEGIKG